MKRLKNFYYTITVFFALSAILFLLAAVYGYQFLSNLQSSAKEEQLRIDLISEHQKILESVSKSYKDVETYSDIINGALPDQKDASQLLSDLDTLAKNSGLKLTLLQSNLIGTKQGGAGDLSLSQTIKGKNAYEMPLDIKLEGSYNSFASFIQNLENYRRIVSISSLEITKPDDVDAATDKITAKLKITTYLKK